jgi:glycosyltransferase involved in cell wall biosynthesis
MNMDRIKTLQLISVRWWNASAYYGVSLAEALNKAGIPSIVGGRGGSPPLEKAREFKQPTFTDINLESLNPLIAAKSLAQLKKFLKEESIALLNAHRPEDGLFGVLSKKSFLKPIPVIRTVSDVRAPKNNAANKWLHEKGMDFLIFSCQASYQRYHNVWPIFENKSAVIYSAIDTEIFRPDNDKSMLRREFGIAANEVVIGIIARLDPVKDHLTFLKAAAKVAERTPHTRFLISGETCNVSHEELQQFARELGIYEKVIFLDRQEDLDVRDLIHSLDIGVVASNGSEVICRISVEYMALGKPQVTTDINVLPEIIEEGENGFVVPAGDAGAMAAEILKLVENAELRQSMGFKARRIAENKYSYSVFAKKTQEIYREVLERKSCM